MEKFTKINQETCIACGSCSAEAPDIFAELDDGIAFSMLDDNKGITAVEDIYSEDLDFAVESCPTESVLVQDTPFQ